MKKILAALPFLFACTALQAAPIQILDLPSDTSCEVITDCLVHNMFHDSSNNGGTSGAVLAWFSLGTGGGSYDPVSGAFNVNIDLFLNSDLTGAAGTAVGSGNLTASAFNGDDGGLIGTITWTFDATAQANGLPNTSTMEFVDQFYALTDASHVANSLVSPFMTLWGSDCGLNLNQGSCLNFIPGQVNGLGVDFVVEFVPVPAAVWLFGSGLIALVGISRRKSRHT